MTGAPYIVQSGFIEVRGRDGFLLERLGPVGKGADDRRLYWEPWVLRVEELARQNPSGAGAIVQLPPGDILCDSTASGSGSGFVFPANTTVFGAGVPTVFDDGSWRGGTVLVLGDGFGPGTVKGTCFLAQIRGVSGWRVENFGVAGRRYAQVNHINSAFRLGETNGLCSNGVMRRVKIFDSCGYGLGAQTGTLRDLTFEDVEIIRAYSDGADFKNREGDNGGLRFINVTVRDCNQQNQASSNTGLDIRAAGSFVSGYQYFGTLQNNASALRLRGGDEGDEVHAGGHRTVVVGTVIHCTDRGGAGIVVMCKRAQIIGSSIRGCTTAINFNSAAEDNEVNGLICDEGNYAVWMRGKSNSARGIKAQNMAIEVARFGGQNSGPDDAEDCSAELEEYSTGPNPRPTRYQVGTGAVADVNTASDPLVGNWRIELESSTTFAVKSPNGLQDGRGVVGTPYTSAAPGPSFSVVAGTTAFVKGDGFTIAVARPIATPGVGQAGTGYIHYGIGVAASPLLGNWLVEMASATAFSVKRPDTTTDGSGVVGVPYAAVSGPTFTVVAGTTPFVSGDEFTIAITAPTISIAPSEVGTGYVTDVSVAPSPLAGDWLVQLTSAATFSVRRPGGTLDGSGTVGMPYVSSAAGPSFTVVAGVTAFVEGDGFTISITSPTIFHAYSTASGSDGRLKRWDSTGTLISDQGIRSEFYNGQSRLIRPIKVRNAITLTSRDSGKVFSNEGATARVDFAIEWMSPGDEWNFYVHTGVHGVRVIAPAVATITTNSGTSAAGGRTDDATVGSFITLKCLSTTVISAVVQKGTWTVT